MYNIYCFMVMKPTYNLSMYISVCMQLMTAFCAQVTVGARERGAERSYVGTPGDHGQYTAGSWSSSAFIYILALGFDIQTSTMQ